VEMSFKSGFNGSDLFPKGPPRVSRGPTVKGPTAYIHPSAWKGRSAKLVHEKRGPGA
jgi:hypothetical protein